MNEASAAKTLHDYFANRAGSQPAHAIVSGAGEVLHWSTNRGAVVRRLAFEQNHGTWTDARVERIQSKEDMPQMKPDVKKFQIGGVDFTAFQVPDPRIPNKAWYALRVEEDGRVHVLRGSDPRDGSSYDHSSIPKLQASIEDIFKRVHKNDPDLFRRDFSLPPRLERIREVSEMVGVSAVFDDERQAWSSVLEDGREHATFDTESASLLAGIRASDTLADDFMLTEKAYVREDDTLLLVHVEKWMQQHPRMSP